VTISVIVVAAGSGERLGSSRPKAFVDLAGRTLLEHSLHAVTGLSPVPQVVVVAPEAWVGPAEELARGVLGDDAELIVVAGGATRTESVRRGLAAISQDSEVVLIHDAARALTPTEVFSRVIDAVRSGAKGVIPTLDVVDTMVPRNRKTGETSAAIDRNGLAITQTPQGFDASALREAFAAFDGGATDDAEVLRASGVAVVAVEGHRDAVKVTYPHDLEVLSARISLPSANIFAGVGIDVHRFEEGESMVVGGMTFDGARGLAGHSDGDVVLHAITDALLGAASLGDLGTHFGSSRPEYAGVSSTVFLGEALRMMREAGYEPQSVAVQYIGNEPRLGAVRDQMGKQLSEMVGAPVHVSATTTDGLGLTGRGEGAAAVAHALVVRH
jgi:2-C-methyl-D-erythritol 4-phosphate cytidylyltransferase/2-C-methyl-D-erythritol 2,4-cyclodiphosphate synthase